MELLERVEVLADADELDRHAGDCLTDSAAPPRASPSSLVMMTPSSSSASLNALALLTASWPVMPSTTSSTWSGLFWRSIRLSCSISSSSTCSRPAVSRITTSAFWRLRLANRRLADDDRVFLRPVGVDRNAKLLADDVQLVDGRGPLQVGGDQQRRAARVLEQSPELAAGGRFAGALQAAHHQDCDVALPFEVQRVVDRAHQVDQLLVDDADDLLAAD